MRLLVRGGLVFDGTGAPARRLDVRVEDGQVAAMEDPSVPKTNRSAEPDLEIIDASGCWVTPGFIDNHTHYDAELEVAPALGESVRHGVTTVTIGSCGLGMAMGDPEDLADMFCRVEGVPRRIVKPLLERVKDWTTPKEYLEHLDGLPLGPNVAVLLGHSTLRAHVMGLGRSLDSQVRPSPAELERMAQLLEEALDAGYLGLSVNTLKWDKMDGDAFRSKPTPSTFARWSELRFLNRILRRRGRIFQGVPNVSTKWNLLLFLLESAGLFRPALKTAVISLVDTKANRATMFLAAFIAELFHTLLRADFRFQSLPVPFDFWIDGLEVPIFEEIGAGTEALHVEAPEARALLLRDPSFRSRFRRQWTSRLYGRAYHRDLDEARIVAAPDPEIVGKTFGEVARGLRQHPVDTLLDLAAEHGNALRWYTVLGNDRPRWLRWIVAHPSVQVGFSDAGAHLRNMAHYNFPLRLLALVQNGGGMPLERAVHRVTGEIADWMGIDAGHLGRGRRADLVILRPEALDERLEGLEEAPMDGFDDLVRLVRRNDDAVKAVIVNGRVAVRDGRLAPELGRDRGFGRVARATGLR